MLHSHARQLFIALSFAAILVAGVADCSDYSNPTAPKTPADSSDTTTPPPTYQRAGVAAALGAKDYGSGAGAEGLTPVLRS